MRKGTISITEKVIAAFHEILDAVMAEGYDIQQVEYDQKAANIAEIKKIHDEALRAHPYNHIAVTSLVTGVSPRKIDYIVNKKHALQNLQTFSCRKQ